MSHCYQNMTDQDYDNILEKIVSETSAAQILAIDKVKMILQKTLNNEVLKRWELKTPAKYLNYCLNPSCGYKSDEELELMCNDDCPLCTG